MSGSAFNGFPLTGNESVLVSPPVGKTTTQAIADLATGGGGGGTFTNLNITNSATLSGSGTVAIAPTGALTINPTAASTINNTSIGVTTAAAGKFTTLGASGAVTLSPASAAVAISPSGTGTVAISPVGALTVNPTAASTINNVSIGVTTPLAGKFTTSTVTTDNGLLFTSQTSDASNKTATMTNGPTTGDPTFWLRISINGTNVAIPAWTAV